MWNAVPQNLNSVHVHTCRCIYAIFLGLHVLWCLPDGAQSADVQLLSKLIALTSILQRTTWQVPAGEWRTRWQLSSSAIGECTTWRKWSKKGWTTGKRYLHHQSRSPFSMPVCRMWLDPNNILVALSESNSGFPVFLPPLHTALNITSS